MAAPDSRATLLISNGHAEDLMGAALARELRQRGSGPLYALPLVGAGAAYVQAAEVVGPPLALPSGGFPFGSLDNLRADLRAGLVRTSLAQWRAAFAWGRSVARVAVVGDTYALAVGALAAPVPSGGEERLRPLTRWLRERGRAVSGLAYAHAVEAVQRVTRATNLAWDRFDVVLTPTLAQPPARHGALRDDADPAADFAAQSRHTPWTSIHNLTGRPAISLPLHTAVVDGVELPFGVMLGGGPHQEALLLALGAQLGC